MRRKTKESQHTDISLEGQIMELSEAEKSTRRSKFLAVLPLFRRQELCIESKYCFSRKG